MNMDINLNDIKKELFIDKSKLDECSSNNPLYVQKYLQLWFAESKKLNTLERKFERYMKEKSEYYKTGYKLIPETQKELIFLIDGDEEINNLKREIQDQSLYVSMLNQTISNFRDRQWAIKNIIEFLKFKEGV